MGLFGGCGLCGWVWGCLVLTSFLGLGLYMR